MTLNKSRILAKYQHDNQKSTSTVNAYISNKALSLRALTIYIIMNKSHGSRFCYSRFWTYCRTWLILTRTAGFSCAVDNTSVSQPERADHALPVTISHTPLSVYTVLDYGVSTWSQCVSRYRQGRSHAVFCVGCTGLRCVQLESVCEPLSSWPANEPDPGYQGLPSASQDIYNAVVKIWHNIMFTFFFSWDHGPYLCGHLHCTRQVTHHADFIVS